MTNLRMTVLLTGATGSIGRLVVDEVIRQGHAVGTAWGRTTAVATCIGRGTIC
jgi:uncharacterized protein YbjT (DUF2867 family)